MLKSVVVLAFCIGLSAALTLGTFSISGLNHPCALRPLTCHDMENSFNQRSFFEEVLVIFAHPDDAETTCGGTVAALVSEGATVRYLVLTSGNKGTSNRTMSPVELARIRQQEQLNAAKVLGVSSVDFIGIDDGALENNSTVREQVTRYVRKYRPQLVLTWDPTVYFDQYNYYLQHSDHRVSGSLFGSLSPYHWLTLYTSGAIALQVAYPEARDYLFYSDQITNEGLETWNIQQVWLYSWQVNADLAARMVAVDISMQIATKVKALLQHTSQIGDPVATSQSVYNTASQLGASSKLKYAEWFQRVVMPN